MKREYPELDGLLARGTESNTTNCPEDVEWIHLALGTMNEERERRLLKHALHCSRCAVSLRRAVDSVEDTDELSLPDGWQQPDQSPARSEYSGHLPYWRQPRQVRPSIWTIAAAAAIFIIPVSWLATRTSFARQKEQIAQSYQSGRPFSFRVAGVPWGPLAQDRGRGSNRVLPLPSGSSPEERLWAARACLWEGDYDTALSFQNAARAAGGESPGLANDVAIAIASRGDRNEAIRLLEEANGRYPRNTTILFNLAILLVQAGKVSQAEPLLATIASLESDENWRREASHLVR